MLKSLYSGVSGMKVNQTKMDVISNNIANTSTVAFKASGTTFKDMLSQTLSSAGAPTANGRGGTNASQVGVGAVVAGVTTDMSAGAPQSTGRPGDLALDQNGFFVISDGTTTAYTRDGSFTLDENGNFISSDGSHVMGNVIDGTNKIYNDPSTNANILDVSDAGAKQDLSFGTNKPVEQLKNIIIPGSANVKNAATGDLKLKVGGTDYSFKFVGKGSSNFTGSWVVNADTTSSKGVASVDITTTPNKTITFGNADFSSFTDVINQLNAAISSAGYPDVKIMYADTTTAPPTGAVTKGSANGTAQSISLSCATTEGNLGGLKFRFVNDKNDVKALGGLNGDWKIATDATSTESVDLTNKTIHIKALTNYKTSNDIAFAINNLASGGLPANTKLETTPMDITSWDPTGIKTTIASQSTVKLTNYGISQDGTITGVYGDDSVQLGKIALASFQNAAGLMKTGGDAYVASLNSGAPQVGDAGSTGYSKITQGSLEMSNVDLATQFTDMITTSRAYQANSKSITTSDEMLQELLGLKR